MAGVTLYDYQLDAINRMKIGCILCGGVGSGKSRTSLAFYYKLYDGEVNTENYVRMTEPPDLYIITTARKRDTGEWDEELAHFYMSTDPEHDIYEHKVVVDSWNNIGKYVGVKNAFFIFDEQRVVGKGAWVKSFYKITQNNEWILLSATPGTAGRIISRCSSPMGSIETERTSTISMWYTANSARSTRRSTGILTLSAWYGCGNGFWLTWTSSGRRYRTMRMYLWITTR